MEKVIVALGGNAIQAGEATAAAQQRALRSTAESLVSLVENNIDVIITHGNGPQVGNLLLQQKQSDCERTPAMPLDTCVAMTEGMIGYWLQNEMENVMIDRNLKKSISTIITRVVVDENDPAFTHPTKPIGPFYGQEEAEELSKLNPTFVFKEDAGRGFRRVVASPKPKNILETRVINLLTDAGHLAVAAGGGGVPVVKQGNHYICKEAVIDKDYASAKLAELVHADTLFILTAVDNVLINFNKPNQQSLEKVTVAELQQYAAEGHFAPGSMLPKVEAACSFVKSTRNGQAIITSLGKLKDAIHGMAGTIVTLE